MRISELKRDIKDRRLFGAIMHVFWEEREFRGALERYKDEVTDDAIYEVIKTVFLTKFYVDPSRMKEYNDIPNYKLYHKEMKSISQSMYGDGRYWTLGTAWEAYYRAKDEENERKKVERAKRLADLDFLYGIPEIHHVPDQRSDIVFHISHSEHLYTHVMKLRDTEPDIDALYRCLTEAMETKDVETVTYFEKMATWMAYKLSHKQDELCEQAPSPKTKIN